MLNDRRRLWTSIIFIGLFAPFVALVLLNALTGRRPLPARAATAGGAGAGPAATTAPAPPPPPRGLADYPLLAAGDGHDLWVLRPELGDNKELGFRLLQRAPNTGVWHEALHATPSGAAAPFWTTPTMPAALAMMLTPADHPGPSSPYLFGESQPNAASAPGWVSRYSLDREPSFIDNLPPRQTIKAATGGADQLFVVTLGEPINGVPLGAPLHTAGSATRVPAPSAPASTAPASTPATAPATTVATGTTPATGLGVTSAPAPQSLLSLNVFWYPPLPAKPNTTQAAVAKDLLPPQLAPIKGQWCMLTPLGRPGVDPADAPESSSPMALLEQGGRLMAFWPGADPANHTPSVIVVRTLDYTDVNQQWSPTRLIRLGKGEEIQPPARLFAITLDHTIYLLWAVPNGGSYTLHGGWVRVPQTGDLVFHAITPMPLNAGGTGISVNDLAVGPSENAIVALVNNRDEGLKAMVFDGTGQLRSGATPVTPESPRHDVQVGQHIAMVLVVLMLILSLWQWRQKQPPLVLPPDTVVAPLPMRALAFGIDAVLPYVAVYFIMRSSDSYLGMLQSWLGLLSNPEDVVKAGDLALFLGIYVGHVTLGELFFRKSLGKAATGLQVMMADGRKPTVAAVLVRNLVRIPEMLVGIVVLYLLMSNRRQRLGDMLAKTVVVAPVSEAEAEK